MLHINSQIWRNTMPTVILLDVSLSMCRRVSEEASNGEEDVLRKHLAVHGCNVLLDHFMQHCKLEFTALVIFSSLYEVVAPFTRDFELIKNVLTTLDEYDMTNLETGLLGAAQHVLDEWGNGTPCQVVLITDGSGRSGPLSLKHSLASSSQSRESQSEQFPLPFPFPSKLNIVCIAGPNEPGLQVALPMYQRLIELNGEGNIFVPEGNLSFKSVGSMFERLIESNFCSYQGQLHCGNLSSPITLSPPPQPYCRHHDFDALRVAVGDTIQICGFLNVGDVSSPPAYSKHLVLPLSGKEDLATVTKLNEGGGSDDEGSGNDEGKIPSFCVLLHGGLKRENMVALCQIGDNWFGILYSWADNKKKSNLMLSLFVPGVDVIPWLGDLDCLGPACLLPENPYTIKENGTPFPVKVHEKRSYSQNCVVWIRQEGLQSDIQKILRHARKLPDKSQSFYKELNRVRKAALAYGFTELLEGLASVLDRECQLLPASANPECALHLSHAAQALRTTDKRDLRHNVSPYKSRSSDD
ncbi:integrator complex subunit 14 isoform X2 [Oratosquilla oratoria]|uniref:integrator complex subunit 14 isoform X2 n=1 Tax=Oratosquilla oratoria TaxID=337810 RepID=UPI003F77173F